MDGKTTGGAREWPDGARIFSQRDLEEFEEASREYMRKATVSREAARKALRDLERFPPYKPLAGRFL